MERLLAHALGFQIVAFLAMYGINAGQIDESGDLYRMGGRHKEILKISGLHDDVLVLGVLVSLSQLVLLHEGLVVCTVLAMVDTCVAGGVQGGEGYVLALGGRIKLDRDRYHPIADGAFSNSSW